MSELQEIRGKRVLITGGAGMIGSTIAHLLQETSAEVTIVDAMLPLYGGNLANLPAGHESLTVVKGDIRDPELMERLVKSADYVFSLAAQVSYLDGDRDPLLDLDINCRGHLTLLEACRTTGSRPKVVFASSRFVYGRIERNPVDESHPLNCISMYGIHKLAAEKYYRFYQTLHQVPAVILRLSNPYGPRQQMKHGKYGIVNWFIRQALSGERLTVYGDGSQARDYVYVEDIAEAFVAAAISSKTDGEIYNVGSGVGTRFREMAELVAAEIPGTEIKSIPWPTSHAIVETGSYISDIRRFYSATGWAPTVSLKEGIRRTVDYYREHRSLYW